MNGEISPQEAKKALETNPGIRLVDVRSAQEYSRGHIKNAINIPLDKIEEILKIIPQKNIRIFVCCKSGMRSRAAKETLESMGYTNVTNIGGILGCTKGNL